MCKYLTKLIHDSESAVLASEDHTQSSLKSNTQLTDTAILSMRNTLNTFESILKVLTTINEVESKSSINNTFTQFIKPRAKQIMKESLHGVSYTTHSTTQFSDRFSRPMETLLSTMQVTTHTTLHKLSNRTLTQTLNS